MRDTGVVDQDVETAKVLHRRLHHQPHVCRHRHVYLQRTGLRAQACGHALTALQVAVGNQHLCTLGHKLGRNALAKARAAASDDGHLAVQPSRRC